MCVLYTPLTHADGIKCRLMNRENLLTERAPAVYMYIYIYIRASVSVFTVIFLSVSPFVFAVYSPFLYFVAPKVHP